MLSDADLKAALLGKVNSAKELADETITSVQKIASELRPGITDRLGLAAAIEVEAQAFESRTGVRCVCGPARGRGEIPFGSGDGRVPDFSGDHHQCGAACACHRGQHPVGGDAHRLELTVADNGVGVSDSQFKIPNPRACSGCGNVRKYLAGRLNSGSRRATAGRGGRRPATQRPGGK